MGSWEAFDAWKPMYPTSVSNVMVPLGDGGYLYSFRPFVRGYCRDTLQRTVTHITVFLSTSDDVA